MMRLFTDSEFDGFGGELISIALVPEDKSLPEFYAAVECPNPTPWVAEHVIPLIGIPTVDKSVLVSDLTAYLKSFAITPHIVADWPEDLTHITRLLITGPGRMVPVNHLTFEYINLPNLNTSRASVIPHNALEDARAIRRLITSMESADRFGLSYLIGQTVEQAAKLGMEIREMEIDGAPLCGTCDFDDRRINVATQQGTIVEIFNIG